MFHTNAQDQISFDFNYRILNQLEMVHILTGHCLFTSCIPLEYINVVQWQGIFPGGVKHV